MKVSPVRPPVVLVVDDEPDGQKAVFSLSHGDSATYKVVHPEDVTKDLLNEADLVLVDYILNNWGSRDGVGQIALRPENGVALAPLLREHAGSLQRPTAFAMHTGHPERLWLTPAEPRRHLIARAYNLEWIFLKSESRSVLRQAPILAAAVRKLPQSWPTDDHDKALRNARTLLGLGQTDDTDTPGWVSNAMVDVEGCRPPLTELSERNHGLVFLRWLLQRILPYPCFLLDSHWLAARLYVSHQALQAALEGTLRGYLAPVEYRGVLAGFTGDRWWRAGVEDKLWELAGGSASPDELRNLISGVAGSELSPSKSRSPIICIDQDYQTLPESYEPSEVVRVQPDDWPSFASQAWTTKQLAVENKRLGAIVVTDEQEVVQKGGGANE
jgi:hypothetical protein